MKSSGDTAASTKVVVSRTPSSVSSGTRRRMRAPHNSGQTTKSVDLNIGRGSWFDTILMAMIWLFFIVFTILVTLGDWLFLPRDRLDWCKAAKLETGAVSSNIQSYPNPDANTDPCYYERTVYLGGWNKFECDFARRMIFATILGAAIGIERKAADRPAGIRTMSLVSLGAAMFSMGGQFAFRSSTQGWDAARVSAAIPSGVGFLGGALIWKESTGNKGPNQRNHVHGVTTAASVWLSASVGVSAGGGTWVCATWTVILVIFVLRFGPSTFLVDDESYRTSDQSLNTAADDIDWENENETDAGSLKTFETIDYSALKSNQAATSIRHINRRQSAAELSIRQVQKQAANLHSD